MKDTLKILQEITTGYSIFEKDQVLTESQLNSVTDYLNDQTRLTSIYLLGVGVVSGLRVSLQNNTVIVTKGIGITTDGDLLFYNNNTVFDRFLKYDESYPKYAPFYTEGGMIPVYELIRQGATDPRSPIFSLSEFATQTNKNLSDMVAVLLMESYVNDPDLCTGTDCDNLGRDCINTPKLLLVDKAAINSLLKPVIATPNEAHSLLNPIVANRPLIPSSISSVSALAQIYRSVCTTIHSKLLTELPNIYPNCAAFLSNVFSSDPTNSWTTRLTNIHGTFSSNVGIQYYYDFLKDIVETYNQFRDLLFGETTWCCPDINWFPKHLLLGNLVPGTNSKENRTTFYPSPAVSQTIESLNHAKFLARKLDTLIQTFQIPATSAPPIRITPSLFADQPLEARAIPYYYQVNETNPIHKSWNYHLHQRGMDAYNYSYNASEYQAEGGASNPLEYQIGHFSFFRIEGHLGQNQGTAFSAISEMIKSHNLPFSVLAATLGQTSQFGEVNFSDLISQQPGIEHCGGVVRGGTFVLLADTNKKVIADFMLPHLPGQGGSSICTLLVKPSDNLAAVLGGIANGQDAHICFEQGTYTLPSRLLLQNKGNLTITGSGKGTKIIAPGLEAVIEFSNCQSVSMSNCYLENLADQASIPTGFANNSEDIKGVLTFINCPSVELEKLSLRCAHQVVRSASCITVRQNLSVTNTQVRIRHCDLQVGYQQIGILLINVERSQIEDNKIQVDRANEAAILNALLAKNEYRLRLLPRLIANAYLGTLRPKGGGSTSVRFDECNVVLNFAGQSIRFKTEPSLVSQWQPLVNAQNPLVRSRHDLLKSVKQLARRILLDDNFRGTLPAFNNWYQGIKGQSTVIASQGIVVVGSRAQEVRILNNTIRGCLQGIHIGISPRASNRAGSVLLTGNRLEVAAPKDQIRERHGIYVGSCDSLMIENNYLQAVNPALTIEGIRISGRLGRMVIVRQNHLSGFNPYGIYFNPLDAYGTEKMQWLVADNIASSAQTFMRIVSNRPGTEGAQIIAKVGNTNNFQ
jgi:hypothetical protein